MIDHEFNSGVLLRALLSMTPQDIHLDGAKARLSWRSLSFPSPPSRSKWRLSVYAIMPVGCDIHRAAGTADLADEPPPDARPGLILGQGIKPDIE